MFSELIESLKDRIVSGITTLADIDTLNTLEEMYDEAQSNLEAFMNKGLDEPQAMEGETPRIVIENMTVYVSNEK